MRIWNNSQTKTIIFAALNVEGFDLIATTEKNAKIVLLSN